MASSSPLSEPPSSPPRSPSRDISRKRGSCDPSTPRTARCLKSVERGHPAVSTKYRIGDTISKQAMAGQPASTTPFEVGRRWMALESNDALRKILSRIYDAENNINSSVKIMFVKQRTAMAIATAQAIIPKFERLESNLGKARNVITVEVAEPLRKVKEGAARTSQTADNLTKAVESMHHSWQPYPGQSSNSQAS